MVDRTPDGLLTNMALRPLVQDIRHGDDQIASDAATELFNAYDQALGRVETARNVLLTYYQALYYGAPLGEGDMKETLAQLRELFGINETVLDALGPPTDGDSR